LVVDDDPDVRTLILAALERDGVTVEGSGTAVDALQRLRERDPDLVTLDLTLPDMDGIDLCRRIREFSDAYIVMITGRDEEIDRLVGLEVGADDYLAKPFSPKELRARVAVLLRRPRLSTMGTLTVPAMPEANPQPWRELGEGLELAGDGRSARLDGEAVPLTPPELDLLGLLASKPGEVWQRRDLAQAAHHGEFIESDFLIDVQIANLRRKLRQRGGTRNWIDTVGGTAYRLRRPNLSL
jgi:DNA-binding response OmpR family regulator